MDATTGEVVFGAKTEKYRHHGSFFGVADICEPDVGEKAVYEMASMEGIPRIAMNVEAAFRNHGAREISCESWDVYPGAPSKETTEQHHTEPDKRTLNHEDRRVAGFRRRRQEGVTSKMSTEPIFLEEGFQPLHQDVIVGRLKTATPHLGNNFLNDITQSYLEEYKQSERNRKSQILAEIYDRICSVNGGRFVKLDTKTKRWFVCTKSVARERISQGFRDSLKDFYKSSLSHKQKRRMVKNGVLPADDPTLEIMSPPPSKRSKLHAHPEDHEPIQTIQATAVEGIGTDATTNPVLSVLVVGRDETIVNNEELGNTSRNNTARDGGEHFEGNGKRSASLLPRDGIILMDEGFEPHKNDVIVGLRKKSAEHPGNIHLVEVVQKFLGAYRQCGQNKSKKSDVLNQVANTLNTGHHPPARFVRFDFKHQRWYEIESFYAREKIGQTFRDILKDGYRSSNTFKNLKRRKSYTGQSKADVFVKKGDHNMDMVERGGEAKTMPLYTVAAVPQESTDSARCPIAPINGANEKVDETAPSIPSQLDEPVARPSSEQNASLSAANGIPAPPKHLSKKEQLKWQIRELQKQLAQLEEDERKGQSGDTGAGTAASEEPVAAETHGDKEDTNEIGETIDSAVAMATEGYHYEDGDLFLGGEPGSVSGEIEATEEGTLDMEPSQVDDNLERENVIGCQPELTMPESSMPNSTAI
ncbi:Nitrilase family, member 2 [Seminavis robusta]|uniref:Nitrilase family, member 2 n=1 Tax=Seminavis robusta TaxID=568900 RepID=A0A9N8E7V5_9STRA|nr:Nitrilase family, member 2 [Seminavis robusta]|eukprot:Sro717_g191980.1 Nitrilase family, member 2 (700) ;mRNA; r:6592-8916